MRALWRGLITADEQLTELIPAERWKGSGSLKEDNAPPRPFAVIRFGLTTPGMATVLRGSSTIWVHDDAGSYGTIDSILARLKAILDGVEHVSDDQGNELVRAEWINNSGDLYDPGFRTITKNITFNLIGKGV